MVLVRGCATALSRVPARGGGSGCSVPGGAAAAPGPAVPGGSHRPARSCRSGGTAGLFPPSASRLPRRFSGAEPRSAMGTAESELQMGEGGRAGAGMFVTPGPLEPLGMIDTRPPRWSGSP